MHELSIAQSILEVAIREAEKNSSSSIRKIKIQIGEFTGVVKEALEFSFDVIKRGTIAENAELEIEIVNFKAICENCGNLLETKDDFNLFCSICGEPMKIVSGREMKIDYIEIE